MNNSDTALAPDAPAPEPPGASPSKPKPDGRRGKVMARPGNKNAMKHGVYASDLQEGKAKARSERDRYREEIEKEADGILESYGLAHDPLAKTIRRALVRLEMMVHLLESWHGQRGYFKSDGTVKPSVTTEIGIINSILSEARRLLDALAEVGSGKPSERERPTTVQEWIASLSGATCPKCGEGEQQTKVTSLPIESPVLDKELRTNILPS